MSIIPTFLDAQENNLTLVELSEDDTVTYDDSIPAPVDPSLWRQDFNCIGDTTEYRFLEQVFRTEEEEGKIKLLAYRDSIRDHVRDTDIEDIRRELRSRVNCRFDSNHRYVIFVNALIDKIQFNSTIDYIFKLDEIELRRNCSICFSEHPRVHYEPTASLDCLDRASTGGYPLQELIIWADKHEENRVPDSPSVFYHLRYKWNHSHWHQYDLSSKQQVSARIYGLSLLSNLETVVISTCVKVTQAWIGKYLNTKFNAIPFPFPVAGWWRQVGFSTRRLFIVVIGIYNGAYRRGKMKRKLDEKELTLPTILKFFKMYPQFVDLGDGTPKMPLALKHKLIDSTVNCPYRIVKGNILWY
jgi:hypothetical protein